MVTQRGMSYRPANELILIRFPIKIHPSRRPKADWKWVVRGGRMPPEEVRRFAFSQGRANIAQNRGQDLRSLQETKIPNSRKI